MADIVTKEMLKSGGPSERESEVVIIGSKNTIDVTVTDINMPFFSMVSFMVKWAVASIPALIILAFLAAIIIGATSSLFYINHRGY